MSELVSYYVRKTSTQPDGYMERMYSADKVDSTIADLRTGSAKLMADNAEYARRHVESLATIAELRERLATAEKAIDWCLANTPYRSERGKLYSREVPAEFSDFIKSLAAADGGQKDGDEGQN